MSKEKEKYLYTHDNTKNKKNIPITYLYLDKSIRKEKSKRKTNNKEKEQYKMKLSYKPKNSYASNNNNLDNLINNVLDSKSSIINSKHQEDIKNNNQEKQSNIAFSNKIEKNIIPIFDKKLLIKNKEKANSKIGRNYIIINKELKNNIINKSNNNLNINKGYFITSTRSKKTLPVKYQLNLDNNNSNKDNCVFYNNNSIMISKNSKCLPGNKVKIVKLENKFDFINCSNNLFAEKGRIITLDDFSFIKDKNKSLKKCLSKPNYANTDRNNNINNNNFIHNILYNSKSNDKFNFDKYKKKQHNTSNIKNNNLHSYQIQAPPRNINQNKKKQQPQSHTLNLNNNNLQNYSKLFPNKKHCYQNIIHAFMDKNKIVEKRCKSRSEAYSHDLKLKNQINNNNININNVYINLDSANDDFFNSTEDKSLVKEQFQLNKRSYSNSYIKTNNKSDLNINNNQIINEIKTLWKKIGGIKEQYKINFIETLNYLNNEDKLLLCSKEKEEIINLLNILEKLNQNLEKRKYINLQLKNISTTNNNNYIKIEFISKLLINLRISSINIIKDYIKFKKEISHDVMNNKYNLNNIFNFPHYCLNKIENDTAYLASHEYLSSLFKFSKNPDPFLLLPSKEIKLINKKYYILPINKYIMSEIQKANYYLIKEKIFQELKKKDSIKNITNLNNNSILIRNIYNSNNNHFQNKKNFQKNFTRLNVNNFEIIKSEIKKFKEDKVKYCPKNSSLKIISNKRFKINNIPCFNIINHEYINNKIKSNINFYICSNNNLEIIKNNNTDKTKDNKFYSISNQISNFEILKSENYKKFNSFNNVIICKNINDLKIKGIANKNIIDNTNRVHNINQNNIPQFNPKFSNIQNQNQIINKTIPNNPQINNQILCPFNEKAYPPLDLLYKAYLQTVNNDIKISFKINPDINYYKSIGCSPKIILFKENNSILYGLATLSYDPSQLYRKALVITSISCANNYSITNILLQLVEYCNREIEYDELILYLYFYENVNKKGEYLLNEEYKNMIKTKTLFKWTALENSGNERKIKYHYKKSFDKNYKEKDSIKILNNYIHIKFYRFIKYNTGKCQLGLTTKECTYLFNILDLIYKYNINFDDKTEELNMIFTKLEGLKKKRLLKIITEFNYAICNLIKPFFEELSKSEDKLFSNILLKRFIGLLQNLPKDQPFNSLGFYCCDISTNFSSIIKGRINSYEYNIISIEEFNIETFRLNNDINNEEYNNYIYFFKSQNKSISFLIYELNLNEENNINVNNIINIEYRNKLFYKLLKRILTKDNDEPVKLYKKIGIPSFKSYIGLEKESLIMNKFADYEILDGNDWFNFCIENNSEDNLFSFPEENIINEDIKIINNSFIIAIINPELTVDYQIPALNIYYINKNTWIKR